MSSTTITVTGNLTADPDLKFFESGDAYCNLSIAVGSRKKNAEGEWVDGDTSFYDATAVGSLAENIANSLTKGTRVVLTGTQSQRHWEDKDGNKRSSYSIRIDSLGPELRWATASVTKNAKGGGSSAPASSGRPAPSQKSFDEEPF